MKAFIFASGSSGNCLLISDNGTNLLIDAGISMRRIETALADEGLSMKNIGGVLITHEHSDHVLALRQMIKKHGTLIFAPHTVKNRICSMLPEAEEYLRIIPVGKDFEIGTFRIRAFHTSHDTDESVGYRFEADGTFALATDTGCVTDDMVEGLFGADTVLIESNHDEDMLRYGPYPYSLKRRILSDKGHMSNNTCADLARYLAENGTGTIILGHISKTNNTPMRAYETTLTKLAGIEAELMCAPELGKLELMIRERTVCLQ